MTKQRFRSFASALALGAGLFATQAMAKSDITIAMQLEPPHLDPTSAAAQAIDSKTRPRPTPRRMSATMCKSPPAASS